jgi:hypothetical protein
MVSSIRFLRTSLNEREIVWRAVGALSLGVLLGVLIAVPYDRISVSAPPYVGWLYAAVHSVITTVTLIRVRAMDDAEFLFEEGPDRVADP